MVHSLWSKAILVLAVLGLGSPAALSATPLCKEGFEGGTAGWSVWSMEKTATFAQDSAVAKEDKASAKIVNNSVDEQIAVYRYLPIEAGKRYLLRFQYKLQGVKVASGGTVGPFISFNKAGGGNGSAGRESFKLNTDVPDSDWQELRKEFTAPAEAVRAQFGIISIRRVTGTIWIDDVVLEVLSEQATLEKTTTPPVIDGRLDDACWKRATALDGFAPLFLDPTPVSAGATAYVAYDQSNLYVAFQNSEPRMALLKSGETNRDGRVWADDSNEVFIVSPGGKKIQLIVNPNNTQWDGELFNKMPGDPYQSNVSWNGQWTSAVSKEKDRWSVEIAIPLSNFGETIQPGAIWHLNLARNRFGAAHEMSQWNHIDGTFNVVEKFAALEFRSGDATLTRFMEKKLPDAFRVARAHPQYQALLSNEPGNYVVGSWGIMVSRTGHYPKDIQAKFTPETWQRELDHIFNELGQAGMFGPQFDYVADYRKWSEQYGMKYWLYLQKFADGVKTAQYIDPGYRRVDPIDPAFTDAVIEGMKKYLTATPDAPKHLALALGKDEPMNATAFIFSVSKNPGAKAMLETVEREIQAKYGQSGLYDPFALQRPADEPFRRIAFLRWWNDRFAENIARIGGELKKLAPAVPYLAANYNHTRSIGFEDVALHAQHSDWVGADPYPTSTMGLYGRERALYHTGFSTKYINDLSGGKTACITAQSFKYFGREPNPENIREWAAQALKNGAQVLFWYNEGPARLTVPLAYQETLRVSNIIRKMNKLKLPATTHTAIFYSNSSTWGTNDEGKMGFYTLYAILGEKCRTWFRFVSDTQLALGGETLANYRLLYLPQLKYVDNQTAKTIETFVKGGGTLVVLDPQAFAWRLDGSSAGSFRASLIGGELGEARKADQILIASEGYCGMPAGKQLELTPVVARDEAGRVMAYDITPPADARVFARYGDGKPAAYERPVGKGKVIYFAAQPFGNAGLALQPNAWADLCLALAQQVGEPPAQPIWDLELPPTGGEVPVNYVVAPVSKP